MNTYLPPLRAVWSAIASTCLLASPELQAQNFTLEHFALSGGGGTSVGLIYTVSGSIGQPTAGPDMAGDVYTMDSGFWEIAVPFDFSEGSMVLTISRILQDFRKTVAVPALTGGSFYRLRKSAP